MTGLYIFFLAVGAPLLVWFAFAGDADADGFGGGDADSPFSIIPLSTLAFIMTFFGLTGLLSDIGGSSALFGFVLAVIVGVVAGGLNSAAFSWLRRNSTSSEVMDSELEGQIARVALPVSEKHRGKIVLEIAGAREQMTAAPADASTIDIGKPVVVVRVEGGVAYVAPLDPDLELD
jgi:membrane protein implicated in regulation of membrane protease activity